MQAIDALLQRFSARILREPAPDDRALALMIESAVRAPDHGRLRPWQFIAIRGQGLARFGQLLVDFTVRTRAGATTELLERERQKALRAPLILVVAAITHAQGKIPLIEQMLSAGAAAQNLLLAAFALGFNAVWKTGGAAYDDTVKAELGLQSKDAIVGFIYVGTEEPGAAPPPRPAAREFVRNWGG